MIRKIMNVTALFIILGGVGLICYPSFSSYINDLFSYKEIEEYQRTVTDYSRDRVKQIQDKAAEYNRTLAGNYFAESGVREKETKGIDVKNFSMLQKGTMLGYVEVPAIDVYLPVYYGTSAEILDEGLGLLEHTSLPIGGVGTHAVISGHTGMASRKIFTDLNMVKEGDLFFVHILNEHLAYQVNQIKVVLPSENDYLKIEEGKDYVTLLTCTPFGVNDHRLLVRGGRIEYDFQGETKEAAPPGVIFYKYLWMLAPGSLMLILLIAAVGKKIRKRSKSASFRRRALYQKQLRQKNDCAAGYRYFKETRPKPRGGNARN